MGESDLRGAALANSASTAMRDAIVTQEAARIVQERVESELKGFTAEEKERFLEVLTERGNVARACTAVGVTRRTAVTARQRDPLFAWAWSEILESKIDDVEDVLHQQCLNPSSANTVARIFYLKAARRDHYGDHVRVAVDHRVDVVVELMPPRPRPFGGEEITEAETIS